MTTLNTLMEVSTPIRNVPVLSPLAMTIGVHSNMELKAASKLGVIVIDSLAFSTGFNDNNISFIYVPASMYKLGLSSPIIINLPACLKSGVMGYIKFQYVFIFILLLASSYNVTSGYPARIPSSNGFGSCLIVTVNYYPLVTEYVPLKLKLFLTGTTSLVAEVNEFTSFFSLHNSAIS